MPIISAVDVEMKTNLSQGETLIAKVSGNFIDSIVSENIYFYRRHMRTSITPEVTEINNEFYIYAPLMKKDEVVPDEYSMVIKNTQYMKGAEVSDEDIIKNFTITNTTADFSVDPGFVVSENNFFIEVQNLQESPITISKQGIGNDSDSITLLSGEIKEIEFDIQDQNKSLETIELSTENLIYEIPVYITAESQTTQKQKSFKIEPSEFNITIPTNSNTTRIIYLYNTGEAILRDISLSVSEDLEDYINLSISEINKIEINSSVQIEFSIFSEEAETIIGAIKAETNDGALSESSEIFLNFIKDYVPSEEEQIYATKTCTELNGTICEENEECNETEVNTKDSSCCLGICEQVEESSIGTIIGWGIIILVVGFLIWFFLKKYKKAKKPIDLLEIAKAKRTNPVKNPSKYREIKKPIIERKFSPPVKIIQTPVRQSEKKPEVKIVEKIVEKPIIKEVEKIVEKPVFKEIEKKVFVERPREKRAPPIRYKYKGSELSKTYHKTSCRLAKLIKNKYKVTNNSEAYFKKRGYKPCKVCLGKKKK